MKPLITCLFILTAFCCSTNPDFEKERSAIVSLLNMERKAHFEKNAVLFMSAFSDTMMAVNRGVVTIAENEKTLKRIQEYFDKVEFVKWDDVVPPKISFSEDATMAYAIVEKQVILSIKDSQPVSLDTTDYAWVAIYRKTENQWKLECNVSTNK